MQKTNKADNSLSKLRDYFTPGYSKSLWLAYCGLFTGLFILLSYFNISITSIIEIRVGYFAIAVAGLIGGPLMGLTVGALGDILKMLLLGSNGAAFFFGFTLSYALMGLFYGLLFYKKNITIVRAILGGGVEFIISLFLNTYWLSLPVMYNMPYKETFITRLPKCLMTLVISSILMYLFIKSLSIALRNTRMLQY